MVLVMIFVLAALIIQFTAKAMTEIAVEGHYADRERLRITAYSALETTLGVLADVIAIDGGLTAPAQGWADPLTTAGFDPGSDTTIAVSFFDESGKLSLGALDEGTLLLMFDRMGLSSDEALHLTQSLLDWIDADDDTRLDGAESDIYGEAEWPHHASNQPVRRLAELALVDGFKEMFFDEAGRPNELYQSFASAVSLFSDGNLNANSASELALRSFTGFGDAQIDALQSYRDGPDRLPGTEDDRFFATNAEVAALLGQVPGGSQLGAQISVLRIHVEVAFGVGRFALEAVVRPEAATGWATPAPPPGDGASRARAGSATDRKLSYPFVFLELTEDVGQNATIAAGVEASGSPSSRTAATKP